MQKNIKFLDGLIDSIFSKLSPKNIYCFGMCPFYSFLIGESQSKLQTICRRVIKIQEYCH